MDSPEKILCQAHGQSRPITDFLHENGTFFCLQVAYAMNSFYYCSSPLFVCEREKHADRWSKVVGSCLPSGSLMPDATAI